MRTVYSSLSLSNHQLHAIAIFLSSPFFFFPFPFERVSIIGGKKIFFLFSCKVTQETIISTRLQNRSRRRLAGKFSFKPIDPRMWETGTQRCKEQLFRVTVKCLVEFFRENFLSLKKKVRRIEWKTRGRGRWSNSREIFDRFRAEQSWNMNELHVAISLSYESACASLKVSHITKADR